MEDIKLIHIGFGNIVNAGKIIAIVSPDSAPIKRLVSRAREDGRTIDATQGRKTKAVIVMENDRIVLSALMPETIKGRAQSSSAGESGAGSENGSADEGGSSGNENGGADESGSAGNENGGADES